MAINDGIVIDCPRQVRLWIGKALRLYVEVTYPPGCGDCALVAREALLASAQEVERDTATATVNRRQRALFKVAINYYFDYLDEQEGRALKAQRALTLAAARGKVCNEDDLTEADRQDAG